MVPDVPVDAGTTLPDAGTTPLHGGTTAPEPGALALLPLVRLLQLARPALPIGACSCSQGLEWAVEEGTVRTAATAQAWIGDLLTLVVARGEAAIAWRLPCAAGEDWAMFARWNVWFRASRETAELRAETEQMGSSLVRLTLDLELLDPPARDALPMVAPITLPATRSRARAGRASRARTSSSSTRSTWRRWSACRSR